MGLDSSVGDHDVEELLGGVESLETLVIVLADAHCGVTVDGVVGVLSSGHGKSGRVIL